MIEEFITINNIGRFRDCRPSGDTALQKLTLLFAENGQGKTTLCGIIRSLQTGQSAFITERKTLGATDPAAVQIRFEGRLRALFPGQFQPNEWLGDFIAKIRNATDADGLSHAKADLEEIKAINEYSKKFHHDQNQNADSEYLSEDELHGFVRRTLKLVWEDVES